MKRFLFVFVILISVHAKAQKYVLLDTHISRPATYSNVVTSADKFNGFFPVEKKFLKLFIKALEEIDTQLAGKASNEPAKQYEMGCTKFTGLKLSVSNEQRLDYVLTSNCSDVKVSMHLSNAKMTNASNAFFIKTWIKYIRNNVH